MNFARQLLVQTTNTTCHRNTMSSVETEICGRIYRQTVSPLFANNSEQFEDICSITAVLRSYRKRPGDTFCCAGPGGNPNKYDLSALPLTWLYAIRRVMFFSRKSTLL